MKNGGLMPDRITKGMSRNYHLRYFAADATDTVRKGIEIHKITAISDRVIFSKLLTAGLMFGADLKAADQTVTLKITLNDLEQYILITANNRGEVKGFPNLKDKRDKLSSVNEDSVTLNRRSRGELEKVLKEGLFTVIKDVGMKRPYNGTTKMITGEIARDITYYFTASEQTPSTVGLTTVLNQDGSIKRAVGFIVQILPEASEETITLLEGNLQKLPELTDLMEIGMSVEDIMKDIVLKAIDYEQTWSIEAKYACNCSKERFAKGLRLLGIKELSSLLEGQSSVSVECHYCKSSYEFSVDEIRKMIEEMERSR
jgi:molecular chaperone Hsp33